MQTGDGTIPASVLNFVLNLIVVFYYGVVFGLWDGSLGLDGYGLRQC